MEIFFVSLYFSAPCLQPLPFKIPGSAPGVMSIILNNGNEALTQMFYAFSTVRALMMGVSVIS